MKRVLDADEMKFSVYIYINKHIIKYYTHVCIVGVDVNPEDLRCALCRINRTRARVKGEGKK